MAKLHKGSGVQWVRLWVLEANRAEEGTLLWPGLRSKPWALLSTTGHAKPKPSSFSKHQADETYINTALKSLTFGSTLSFLQDALRYLLFLGRNDGLGYLHVWVFITLLLHSSTDWSTSVRPNFLHGACENINPVRYLKLNDLCECFYQRVLHRAGTKSDERSKKLVIHGAVWAKVSISI